jgi:hypothetical protein
MTQVLPAALVAPTQVSLSADAVGYLIRTIAGVEGSFVSNTGTAGAISKVASTGYFYATTGIIAPDDGGVLEWYISNAGVKSTFLSAVAIEPAPNQADQAAGIRAALGLASANVDTQLSAINSKTTNLPAAPAAVSDIPTTTQIWTHATRALTDKDSFNLASSQTFSTTGSVGSVTGSVGSVTGAVTVGTLNNNVITAGSIASGAITNAKFAAGAIDAAAIATDAITAAKIATDAFDADAIAASAVTEIQAGLATQASVDALPNAPAIADAVWDEALSGHTIAGSTGKKLADTSTLTVGDIPAGLSAQQVWEYTTRALTGTQATNLAAIPNIPTNPLLTNDARLNNLDATISSRSTLTAAQIRTELATELARLDVAVSTRLATAGYTTPPTTNQIAAAVEAALLNDADGQALLAAIQTAVQALFDQQADVPVATLVSLIAAQITADHGSGSYTTANVSALALEATAQGIKAKTDNLPSDPADQSTLADLINTKASQASVNAIPTTPLLAANYTAPDNAGIAAIKAKTDNLPSDPADQSELATLISAIPTVAPDNAGIAAIKAKTDNLPSDPADQSTLADLINTRLAAADYVAPNNAGILTAISALPSAPTIADAVWDEPLSGHLTAGTTGAKLNLASTLTVGDIPAGLTAQQVWEYATRTLTTASGLTTEQNTRLNELWRKAGLDLATPVVRTLNPATGNVTETLGATTITHTETNSGNTVTTARQP